MSVFQSCNDMKDSVELFHPLGLYLKPTAKLNISVHLPTSQLPGKTISNWEVMEKLKQLIKPEEFVVLKVSKSTLEFLRFDAEIEHISKLSDVIKKIDLKSLKLAGFPEALKIRAAEAKVEFPTRHMWDSFFRDAKNMNEMKAGERPDTLHISNLPCKWFVDRRNKNRDAMDKPNEYIFRKVFEVFGEVRCVDVPVSDPYRNRMKAHISGVNMFSFGQDNLFEGYVQYKEYMSFVRAMDALRGMKLVMKDGDKIFSAGIKVQFDKTKHLSEAAIRHRKIDRDKLMAMDREKEEKERIQQELEEKQREKERLELEELEKSKLERRKEREEKRKEKQLRKLRAKEAEKMNKKIATEEKKLLMAQRQLESIRLLDHVFERIKIKKQQEVEKKKEEQIIIKEKKKKKKKKKKKEKKSKVKKEKLNDKKGEPDDKLVKKFGSVEEEELEKQREKLRKAMEGKNKLRSVLAATCAKVTKTGLKEEELESKLSGTDTAGAPHDTQGFCNNAHPGAAHWFPMGNGDYGFFNNMQGCLPSCSSFTYPSARFQSQRGFFPRGPRGSRGPRRPRRFRKGGWPPSSYYYDNVNDDYYRYFKRLTMNKSGSHSSSQSRASACSSSRSRSRARSRSRTRSKNRSRTRSSHRSQRSRSHADRKSRSRSESSRQSKNKSRSRSRSRNRSRTRLRNRSRSMSRSRHRSRSKSRRRSRSRSNKRSRNRSSRHHRGRSGSKSKRSTKSRSKSKSRKPTVSESRSHSKKKSRLRSKSPHVSKDVSSRTKRTASKNSKSRSRSPCKK